MNSSKKPTISVVIPAYNEEKYLPKTLESLAQLKRKADEIIVIDGGSTDTTASVAKSLEAKVVTIEHRGIGFARQKGLESARGDIVAFTDADTQVPTDWLTKVESTLLTPGVVAVYSGFRVPDGWWLYRWYVNYVQPLCTEFYDCIGIPFAPGQNTAFWKTKALAVGGYPMDFKLAEDIEIARRLRQIGRVVYRRDNYVTSSGRRGKEGISMLIRISKAFFYYFTKRKADLIGFPDER